MQVEKAMQRLIWRFEKFPLIKVNERDLDAMDTMVDYFNHLSEEKYLANTHFSKLYAHTLNELIKKYETTIDNPMVHRELHRILDTPFSLIAYHLTENMNDKVRESILELANCKNILHPLELNQKQKNVILANLQSLLKDKTTNEYLFQGAWTLNEVEKGLKTQIKNYLISNGINKTKTT